MTKLLDGRELAGFIKERQSRVANSLRAQNIVPKLLILRDNDSPVIEKYVLLKQRYGEDIGVVVEDKLEKDAEKLKNLVSEANSDPSVSAIIVQLPLKSSAETDAVLGLIAPEKDVDGLSKVGKFDSATATAINWLLAGYNIDLSSSKIALVGRGRLVGAPLEKMFKNSGFSVTTFEKGDSLSSLNTFDVIISATGVPGLIKNEFIKPGAVVVDAGTASEDGVLKGDLEESVRERSDLKALTPKFGGVGPMTVSVLFENVLSAAQKSAQEPK
ncbi:bifunctional 5,10-methylenetetrahydrofolate dehydrogenase/5,10-methenyltetrahydrofolate cyclohydrolase [Candidatus Saccharibacteria bacterium]|nr:bifunctional 5,10-methylenetetrahydrofolate dehydrogenase/5,10-methenyltetrahydrofolate cyclohydrolase [Candidatus Saccharibacteria bacterium]